MVIEGLLSHFLWEKEKFKFVEFLVYFCFHFNWVLTGVATIFLPCIVIYTQSWREFVVREVALRPNFLLLQLQHLVVLRSNSFFQNYARYIYLAVATILLFSFKFIWCGFTILFCTTSTSIFFFKET